VITAKYDADKQRWRELVAAKTTSNERTAVPPVAEPPRSRNTRAGPGHRAAACPTGRAPARFPKAGPDGSRPAIIAARTTTGSPMAQYVYTMNRVGKIVPPKRVILKDISLSFFPAPRSACWD
jgi:hypothetical protein